MVIMVHGYMWTYKFSWCDTLGASDAAVMVHARVVYKFVTGLGSAVGATVVEVRLPARNEPAMTHGEILTER